MKSVKSISRVWSMLLENCHVYDRGSLTELRLHNCLMQHKPNWHMKANRRKILITSTPHAWAWCGVLWESIEANSVPVTALRVAQTLSAVCRRMFLVVKLKAVCCKTHDLENYLPQNLFIYFFHFMLSYLFILFILFFTNVIAIQSYFWIS